MNNTSYISYLDKITVSESSSSDAAQTFSGTMPENFSTGSSTEQNQPNVQLQASNTLHNDESLFSTYKPVNRSSITPVHQLLF